MIRSRSDLIEALTDAAELEHAICCQYLFAAYSMKRRPEEGGVDWVQLARVQAWERTLLEIAKEEMKHLGLVCNLLSAVGGAPHFSRPPLPQPAGRYGGLPAMSLRRFSLETLDALVEFETPEHLHIERSILEELDARNTWGPDAFAWALESTVGQIATDAQWAFAEAWAPGPEGRLVRVHGATHVDDPSPAVERLARISRELGGPGAEKGAEGDASTVAHRWWSDPSTGARTVPLDADAEPRRHEALAAAGLNRAATVPVEVDGETVALLVFFLTVHHDEGEDDATVSVASDVVNAPYQDLPDGDLEPNRLGGRLARLAAAWSPGAGDPPTHRATASDREFSSLGALYRHLAKGLAYLASTLGDDLFIGPSVEQVELEEVEKRPFGVTPVTDLASARAAIGEIVEEGEGAPTHEEDSHFGRLLVVRKELATLLEQDPAFQPARLVVDGPVSSVHSAAGSDAVTLLTHPLSVDVARVLNKGYAALMTMLCRFFSCLDDEARADIVRHVVFRPMMTMVVRPLCEILTALPAFGEDDPRRAGPTFELSADVQLLPHAEAFWVGMRERLLELSADCLEVAGRPGAPERLGDIGRNAARLAERFDTASFEATR